MSQVKENVIGSLREMDSLFEGFYTWFGGQFDPAAGGFYYARSSFDMENFIPDIESTAQALNMMERSGLLAQIPDDMREKLIGFFQRKQDPQTGYFFDADPNMRKDDVMVMRALGYSSNSLRKLGGEPLYPLPQQSQTLPAYLETPDTYVAWLKGVDLRNSWRGCDFLGTPNHHLQKLKEEERAAYIEAGARYFASIQDPETGLWGGGNGYIRISGTFKLCAFYRTFGVPVPNIDVIYRAILHILRTEKALDMCWIRNPIDLLGSFYPNLPMPQNEWAEILGITVANMRTLLRPDGGFSRELKHSPKAPNVAQVKEGEFYPNMPAAVPIGQGLVEGDMNAGTQALLIREFSYLMSEQEHLPLKAYTDDFWKAVNRGF